MLKNLTISGKVNLITEIIAIITWAILLIAAKDDWLFFAVFSIPLLILIPICGWFLMPVSKKISEKGKSKSGWWKAAWYAGMFIVNLLAAFMLMILLCAGVGALIEKIAIGSLIDVGPALVLGFMLWMAAFGVFFLASYTFESCINLENVILPPNLEKICDGAFKSTNLSNIKLTEGLKEIRYHA